MCPSARRACVLAVALTALLMLAAAPASAQSTPRVPDGFFGVLPGTPTLTPQGLRAGEAAAMRRAGVGVIRVDAPWFRIEAVPGTFDFSETDRVVLSAAAQRLRVLPVVLYAPDWARVDQANFASRPRSPELMQPYLRALVARYGPRGSLWAEHPEVPRLPIRRWQIWNEPDTTIFWDDGDDWPRSYTALLRASHRTLHAADRGVEVVAAGLTNESFTHLRQLLSAGAGPYMDVAAVHAFSGSVANVVELLRRFRAILDARGRRSVPIIAGELTWSSVGGRTDFPPVCRAGWESGEAGQAARVSSILRAVARVRRDFRLDGAFWASWLSPPLGGDGCFDYNGLRRLEPSGRVVAKPALRAWTRTVRALER